MTDEGFDELLRMWNEIQKSHLSLLKAMEAANKEIVKAALTRPRGWREFFRLAEEMRQEHLKSRELANTQSEMLLQAVKGQSDGT
jgi:hypothetical protein